VIYNGNSTNRGGDTSVPKKASPKRFLPRLRCGNMIKMQMGFFSDFDDSTF
jgi:hypothetical protein